MHVPYSMDDSELDLCGGMGGGYGNLHNQHEEDQYETQTKWESEDRASAYTNTRLEYVECTKFYTQEDMNNVIRASLINARNQYDEGFADGYKEGNENCQHR